MASINHLPTEILVHIFSFYAHDTPQEEIVRILGSVCWTWRNALNNCQFWKIFDGSVSFKQFQWLCKKGLLKNTEEVTFSPIQKVSNADLKHIFINLPNLKRVNFSKVGKWSDQIFFQLETSCPKLCEIVMSDEHTSRGKISCSVFEQFLQIRGSNLTILDLSHSYLINVQKLFMEISRTCPNLQELSAHNLGYYSSQASFPISDFQQGCPQLKVLQLGHPFRYNKRVSTPFQGFSELEVFSHFSLQEYLFSDDCLQKMLFQSEKLKVLDVRGCYFLSSNSLLSLPCKNLERLYISKTRILTSRQLPDVLTRWRHSLVVLDVSKTDSEEIDDIFLNLVSWNRMPCIETLIISGTKLGPHALKEIIVNCPTLKVLHLEGCRRVGRGLMRTFYSRMEINRLLDILENPSLGYAYLNKKPKGDSSTLKKKSL